MPNFEQNNTHISIKIFKKKDPDSMDIGHAVCNAFGSIEGGSPQGF